jgi:hypothetical protein
VRAVSLGATSTGPAAIAMSDNVASQWGWYQVSGSGPVKSGTVADNASIYLTSTAGTVDDTVIAGQLVAGMVAKAATSGGFTTVQFDRPTISPESGSAALATVQTDLDTAEAAIVTVEARTAVLEAFRKITLTAAAEAADAIVVTGQVTDLLGVNIASAVEVLVRTLAVTDDKGDITVTAGTGVKTVNPASGENVSWITTTATGGFAVSVANDAAETTLVHASTTDGLTKTLKLTFT